MSLQTGNFDFKAVYFDTNVLLRGHGWPVPTILLNNLFRLAALCGIENRIPEPVIKETEEHWLREMKEAISRLANARKEVHKSAKPVECDVKVDLPALEWLLQEYRKQASNALKEYEIVVTPFTQRETAEIFGFATKYVLPFAHKSEGKEFQDAVILLSILDHLSKAPDTTALFVTADSDFAQVVFAPFTPSFNPARLKILSVEDAIDHLSNRYYHQSVVEPYKAEEENALAAAEKILPEILNFIRSNLSTEMMKTTLVGTVTKLLSVEGALVIAVDTPIPEPEENDRPVEILIRVIAECRALMIGGLKGGALQALRDLIDLKNLEFFPSTEERESVTVWHGAIKAAANVINRDFKNIRLLTLLPDDTPVHTEKRDAAEAGFSPEIWQRRRLEKKIIESVRILPGEAPQKSSMQDKNHRPEKDNA